MSFNNDLQKYLNYESGVRCVGSLMDARVDFQATLMNHIEVN